MEGLINVEDYAWKVYVRSCWLAMPLGAGYLSWVLASHKIEEKIESLVPPLCAACLNYQKLTVFSSGTFFTLIYSQSAIAQCIKLQYYRELVHLIELGSPQPLVITLALLGPH